MEDFEKKYHDHILDKYEYRGIMIFSMIMDEIRKKLAAKEKEAELVAL